MNTFLYITNRYVCPVFSDSIETSGHCSATTMRDKKKKKTIDNPNRALSRVHIILLWLLLFWRPPTWFVYIRDTFSIIIFVISYYYTHSHCMMPPNDAPLHTILNQTNPSWSILLYTYVYKDYIIMVETTVYSWSRLYTYTPTVATDKHLELCIYKICMYIYRKGSQRTYP